MNKFLITSVLGITLITGCTSVPMESKENDTVAKHFNSPSEGKAGLYVYRNGSFGAAIKKDVWVNGKCLGETAPNMFFYEEIIGGKEHKISTESEFSPNDLIIKTENGKNYFVSQYIKLGVFVGGAGLKLVDEQTGKEIVSKLDLAKRGICSKK